MRTSTGMEMALRLQQSYLCSSQPSDKGDEGRGRSGIPASARRRSISLSQQVASTSQRRAHTEARSPLARPRFHGERRSSRLFASVSSTATAQRRAHTRTLTYAGISSMGNSVGGHGRRRRKGMFDGGISVSQDEVQAAMVPSRRFQRRRWAAPVAAAEPRVPSPSCLNSAARHAGFLMQDISNFLQSEKEAPTNYLKAPVDEPSPNTVAEHVMFTNMTKRVAAGCRSSTSTTTG